MSKKILLTALIPLALLTGCDQYKLNCEKDSRQDSKLIAGSKNENMDMAAMKQQLKQVTLELVKVKVQRDLLKQEVTAYKKRELNK